MAPSSVDAALHTDASGAPQHGYGGSNARRHDGRGESAVGRASDSRRIVQAGHHGVGADGVPTNAAPASPPVTDVADLSVQSCRHAGVDGLLTVPTLTGRVLFVLVLLTHQRRRIIHVNVTEHPTAVWTAQQIIEAFPNDTAPRWLLRDRDAIYGDVFRRRVAGMGIAEVISSPSSPWQNPYAERLIGSIRRECLDHVVVLGERHLRRVLAGYIAYYQESRTHLSLAKDAPTPRRVQNVTEGDVIAFREVGGLHHRYERRAA
jgi:putative transposase